jgi:hypothetical protein
MDRIPRRLRVAFSADDQASDVPTTMAAEATGIVDFVAYGNDCVLSGRTTLDGDRLSDMLNDNDEYALMGVTVERFDGGPPIAVDDVVVAREELWLVHAGPPRGVVGRRMRTAPQHVAIQMGPYQVRGFIHGRPGADAVAGMTRRKPMIPLTKARIAYTMLDDEREVRVETLIVNRERIDWVQVVEPDRSEFPAQPGRATIDPKRLAADNG